MTSNIDIKALETVAGGRTGWTCRNGEFNMMFYVRCYAEPDFNSALAGKIPFYKCVTILEEKATTYSIPSAQDRKSLWSEMR